MYVNTCIYFPIYEYNMYTYIYLYLQINEYNMYVHIICTSHICILFLKDSPLFFTVPTLRSGLKTVIIDLLKTNEFECVC